MPDASTGRPGAGTSYALACEEGMSALRQVAWCDGCGHRHCRERRQAHAALTALAELVERAEKSAALVRRGSMGMTVELGTDRGSSLVVEIHPPSQTATVRTHWPGGEFRAFEHLPLAEMIDDLHAMLKEARRDDTG